MSPPIRVVVVDDHEIVREGLRTLLGEQPGVEIVGEAGDGEAALAVVSEVAPDVVLLDLLMPGLDGLATLRALRERGADAHVVVLSTAADEESVAAAIAAGATGYLLKDVSREALVETIEEAHRGRPSLHPEAQRLLMSRLATPPPPMAEPLTPRELDVLTLVVGGRSNRQIADDLGVTEGTVKGHVSNVLGKLGARDRTQAALHAVRRGIVPLDPS